ncbi:MAG TPA: DNA mismatch repair endonuclease MutL [Candidatus Treponema faecavium]|nr:DNA mismatch repair endonuclease MutL [Candidatus Treponema faecavium]
MAERRPVLPLPPETARKIAAGEVIDRPCAIVRELLDNAVDAGAAAVAVEIDGGGIDRIRVADNGIGMTKADLENCARPHATSKIVRETDLLSLDTLGFRGEALASIAAVSRLEITSIDSLAAEPACAWKLQPTITGQHAITAAQLARGTVVQTQALFENFPARRRFLKRPAAEGQLCRQLFAEKALPRTDTAFRLIMDGKLRLDLPARQTPVARFVNALELDYAESLFKELHIQSAVMQDGKPLWHADIIIGDPAVYRSDRRAIYIYANGRRISEYSLVQAIEYGCQGYFPNGTHPIAALFLYMAPELVDFNIHPAKREARFKDLGEVHQAVSRAVRESFRSQAATGATQESVSLAAQAQELFPRTEQSVPHEPCQPYMCENRTQWKTAAHTPSAAAYPEPAPAHTGGARISYGQFEPPAGRFVADSFSAPQDENPLPDDFPVHQGSRPLARGGAVYYGTALGVFLLVQKDDTLYLIDQHAAHERILFNAFIAAAGKTQRLLIPYVVETENEADSAYLRGLMPALAKAGFDVREQQGSGAASRYEFSGVPAQWHGTQDELARDLLERRIEPQDLLYSLAASTACRAAVKDGHMLDSAAALDLALAALELDDPHCPHGRPLWTALSKDELFKLVRRTE